MDHPEDRIVRLPEVLRRLGISRSKLFDMVRKGHFPPPIHLGPQARGWMLSAFSRWLEQQPGFDASMTDHTPTLAWEAELDALGPFAPEAALRAHLARAPAGAAYLAGYLASYLAWRTEGAAL